jgi:hypothetical protein
MRNKILLVMACKTPKMQSGLWSGFKWMSVLLLCAAHANAGFLDEVITCINASSSCVSGTSQVVNSPTGSESLSGTFGPTTDQFTISGTASSSYGALHMFESSSVSISGTPATLYLATAGNFTDTLTINDPALTGTVGDLVVGYTLDAMISSSGIDQGSLWVGAGVGSQTYTTPYASTVDGSFTFPTIFTFTYGTPFSFLLAMEVDNASGVNSLPLLPPLNTPTLTLSPVTGTGSATVDASNTLVLSLLEVETSGGTPVSGVTFSSASGTVYGLDGVVPEPSTVMLLMLPLLTVLLVVRKRLRRS